MVGRKVDGQILFGARSEKPTTLYGLMGDKRKIYLVPNDSYENFYLAVKGLIYNFNSEHECLDGIVVRTHVSKHAKSIEPIGLYKRFWVRSPM